MSDIRVLGIDLGTTALKAVISDGHRVFAAASAPIATSKPQPLWSEQRPDDWWTALRKVCGLLAKAKPTAWAAISAVSLSGHMHGAVLLRNGKPLRPCILHNDGRAVAEAATLNRLLPGHAVIAGVRAMAGFTGPKLLWLKQHEPEIIGGADFVLAPKDYLRFKMTGEIATDPVDASGMWLLNVGKRHWESDLIEACGLKMTQLPHLQEANALAGLLTSEAAKSLGLKCGIAIITGTGDAAANSLGLGLVNEGDGVLSLGTAAQIFVSKTSHVPAPHHNIHAFAHALPNRWFQMAAMLNGASPLAWIAQRLGRSSDIAALLRAVEKRMQTPSRLLYLPFLNGERTPYDDPAMRAAFYGLDAASDDIDLVRAVLEGVALSLADSSDALSRSGTNPHTLFAVGGGLRSPLWAKIIASAIGRPLNLIAASEFGGAVGVARLARMSVTGEGADRVFLKPKVSMEVAPDPDWQDIYGKRLMQYRELYAALRPIR